jgi:hypothetical protein
MCGADISHRPWNAVYCEECSKIQRLRNQYLFHKKKTEELEAKLREFEKAKPLTSIDTQEPPQVSTEVKTPIDGKESGEEAPTSIDVKEESTRRTVIHTRRRRGRPPKPKTSIDAKDKGAEPKPSKDVKAEEETKPEAIKEDEEWWD